MCSVSSPFSLFYHLSPGRRWLIGILVLAIIVAFFPVGRILLATGFWLVTPGYLLERQILVARPHWLFRLVLWNSLGLSILPPLYLWITTVGAALPASFLIAGAIGLTGVALRAAWHDLATVQVRPSATMWLLAGVLAIAAWLRAGQIADLAMPAWVDSVHHALLVRVAAETGRAPWTLTPYLPVVEMPYHWGYHVLIAAAWHLGGGDLPAMLLWSGQLLNWLQGVVAAALALLLWRRPLAAVIAATIVSCISWMPAYYVSWGRYTQLSGLVQLGALAISWQHWLCAEDRRERIGWLTLSVVMIAGLSLVHMRMFIFSGALIGAQSVVWALRQSRYTIGTRALQAVWAGLAAIALTAPWWSLLIRRILLPAAAGTQSLTDSSSYVQLNLDLMWVEPNRWLVALALVSAITGIVRRQLATVVLMLWVGGLSVLTNPWLVSYLAPSVGLGLLIAGLVQRRWVISGIGVVFLAINPSTVQLPFLWLLPVDIVAISLFLPMSSMIGGGVALIWPNHRLWRIGGTLALTALTLWGAYQQRTIVNPVTVLATAADRAALTWIAGQTPPTARFLINAAPWLPGMARGTDGGWWILPLTGRWTSTPPVLFVYGEAGTVQAAQHRSQQIIDFGNGKAIDLDHLIAIEQIDYIYTSPAGPLRPEHFAHHNGYEAVFAQDGIVIYRVLAPPR